MIKQDFNLTAMLKNKLFYFLVLFLFASSYNPLTAETRNNNSVKPVKAENISVYSPEENYRQGNKALALKDYENAIDHYQKVIEVNPNNIKAFDNLGIAYKNLGKLEKASKIFEKSLEINPHNLVAFKLLAGVYLLQKKNKECLNTLKKAKLISTEDPEIYFALGNVYSVMGEFKLANFNYKTAYDLYSNKKYDLKSDACTNIAINYFKEKKYPRAIEYFEKAIELNMNNMIANYYLGISHLLSKPVNKMKAQKHIKTAVILGYPANEEILSIVDFEEKDSEK